MEQRHDRRSVSLSDFKGDFEAVWRGSSHSTILKAAVARALALEGEDPEDALIHSDA